MSTSSIRISPMKTFARLLAWLVLAMPAFAVDVTMPAGQVGVAYTPYNFSFSGTPAAGTVYSMTGLPSGMSINASTGTVSGTPLVAGSFSGTLSLTNGALVDNYTYALTIAPALGTPAITSELTALGAVGEAFVAQVSASNSPTSYNIGALPAGLSFNAELAQITGTPSTAGTYQVSISANNSSGTGDAVTLVITIDPSGPVPAIMSAATVTAPLNATLTYEITATNTPTSYAASGLPVGLSLNTSTGVISGTPTVGGISQATLTASNGNGASSSFTLTFVLGPVAVVDSASTITGYAGVAISTYQLSATNSPTSFNVGTLPTGLSYSNSTKQITGTPSVAGNATVTISANNDVGTGPAFALAIQIAAPVLPSISTHPASQTKYVGESVTFTVSASGAPTPTYQWFKGDSAIDSATASSYTIATVALGDAAGYKVTVTNVAGSVTSNVATLTVNQLGYAAWRTSNFSNEEIALELVSGPAADPDADGLNNLVEYALGLNPKVATTSGLPEAGRTSTDWTFTYTRPASDRGDLTYTVQYSTNLTTWSSATTHARIVEGSTETWRATVPTSTGSNVFFRLKIERATE